jgi:hypothetical protein
MKTMKDDEAANMKPSKVLRAAVDLLQQGWCQKHLGIRDKASCWQAARHYGLPIIYREAHEFQPGLEVDSLCLQGALMKAAVDLMGVGWPAKDALMTPEQDAMLASYCAAEREVAAETTRRTGLADTARWNDAAGRTQAEVVALVLDVAAHEEAAGR